jgi:rhamnose utilization protein RhaD (predicted bifunctional aldolase and dehydrogenase)
MAVDSRVADLADLSARLGADPSLTQAATGNTSIKCGEALWIKASGKWLAHARREDIFIPLDLAETRKRVWQTNDPGGRRSLTSGEMRASVETAMHAVLPQAVVLHVHSVNTIAWAVRRDGPAALAERLAGLAWQWIPFVASGLPLAREIEAALARSPRTNVLVLANHGLTVCGDDCGAAETLLRQVEERLAIEPRPVPPPDDRFLAQCVAGSGWRLPEDDCIHALATDPLSIEIVSPGVLYPCQSIFLSPKIRSFPRSELADTVKASSPAPACDPFLIVEGAGVVVNERVTDLACATLAGLARVAQRLDRAAPIRYLEEDEIRALPTAGDYGACTARLFC